MTTDCPILYSVQDPGTEDKAHYHDIILISGHPGYITECPDYV